MARTTLEVDKSTLGILKDIGRKNQTYDDIIKRRIKCDNLECENAGSIEIPIDNKNFGVISLFVCSNCGKNYKSTLIGGRHTANELYQNRRARKKE